MKKLIGLGTILLISINVFVACVNQKSKAIESKYAVETTTYLVAKTFGLQDVNSNEDGQMFSSDFFLNKTFYYIEQTDSGLVVVDWYDSGLSGIRISNRIWEEFGLEQFVLIFDSIETNNDFCVVYLKHKMDSNKAYPYRIEPVFGKPGFILINEVSMLVDSAYIHTVKFVQEEPYDEEEVWANDPANQ